MFWLQFSKIGFKICSTSIYYRRRSCVVRTIQININIIRTHVAPRCSLSLRTKVLSKSLPTSSFNPDRLQERGISQSVDVTRRSKEEKKKETGISLFTPSLRMATGSFVSPAYHNSCQLATKQTPWHNHHISPETTHLHAARVFSQLCFAVWRCFRTHTHRWV